ncbi:hypothetical protein K6L09_20695 [Burkholderia cepacia]
MIIRRIVDFILGDGKSHNSRGTKLNIELVPFNMHGKNARAVLTPETWKETCTITHKKNGYQCVECGARKEKLECHERWFYRIKKGQTPVSEMVDLLSLCHKCHMGKHIEFAKRKGEYKEVKAHLKKVYGLNELQFLWKVYKAKKRVRWLRRFHFNLDLRYLNDRRFAMVHMMMRRKFTSNEIGNCKDISGNE